MMDLPQQLSTALEHLQAQDFVGARSLLLSVVERHSDSADAWQLLALAHQGLDQIEAAEAGFSASLALSEQPDVRTHLGDLCRSTGRFNEALTMYDRALIAQPTHIACQMSRAQTLFDLGQWAEAEQAFVSVLKQNAETINARLGLAQCVQYQGRQQEAVALFQQVLAGAPDNTTALNGLGISLKMLGYVDDATNALKAAAIREPESGDIHSNLASAFASAGREEEAIAAYRHALERQPDNIELHDWFNGYLGVMGHPDYLLSYRRVLAQSPGNSVFTTQLARKLLLNDRGSEALTLLETALPVADEPAALLRELSRVRRELGQFDEAVLAAREAAAQQRGWVDSQQELATAILASAGDYEEAWALLSALVRDYPLEQGFWALYLTALRYTQRDDEYEWVSNYDRFINIATVEPPAGFDDCPAFIAQLRSALTSLHTTTRHPVEQSVVCGTQTLDDLFSRQAPFIRQLCDALYQQLKPIVAQLPHDATHPLLGRNTGDVGFSDSWSVLLHQRGFHKNHYHSAGWMSSVFYVTVPDAVNAGQREGWISFGEPGFRAREPLLADHWIKPEEGALVVFPSYLWHGTTPLATAKARMTVGYDVLPI